MVMKANNKGAQTSAAAATEQKALATVPNPGVVTLPPAGGRIDIMQINAGVIEGFDGFDGGNRVSIDGTDFEFKGTERREREMTVIIASAKKLYQFWDKENNNQLCQSFDGRISTDGLVCATCEHKRATVSDDKCKLKAEIHWFAQGEDGETVDMLMTLPTVSAMAFIDYLKIVGKAGNAINQVITKMTIKRETNRNDKTIKFSKVVFEQVGVLSEEQSAE